MLILYQSDKERNITGIAFLKSSDGKKKEGKQKGKEIVMKNSDLAGSTIDLGQNADWISIWAGVDLQGYFYTHSRNIHRIKLNHTISFYKFLYFHTC